MAFFGVTIESIASVHPIPDADRIVMAKLEGKDFQFVIMKDQFKAADRCVYFPIDSILPDELIERLGLTGKLAGKKKNRVKTVKLRGQISQGLVSRLDILSEDIRNRLDSVSVEEITESLGVTKWDPPETPCHDGVLRPLPDGQSEYDIEGADRFMDVAEKLMDETVVVTEKLEGTNFSVKANVDGSLFVSQKSKTIIPEGGMDTKNTYWRAAYKQRVTDFAQALAKKHGKDATVYGELIGPGIQCNIYNLKDYQVMLFDIRVAFNWLSPQDMEDEIQAFYGNLDCKVPTLFKGKLRDWLDGKSIKEASNGPSILMPKRKREGIVIRPLEEREILHFGRLILKQRSPEYLVKG